MIISSYTADAFQCVLDTALDLVRWQTLTVFAGFAEQLTHIGKLGSLLDFRELGWWNHLADDVSTKGYFDLLALATGVRE